MNQTVQRDFFTHVRKPWFRKNTIRRRGQTRHYTIKQALEQIGRTWAAEGYSTTISHNIVSRSVDRRVMEGRE